MVMIFIKLMLIMMLVMMILMIMLLDDNTNDDNRMDEGSRNDSENNYCYNVNKKQKTQLDPEQREDSTPVVLPITINENSIKISRNRIPSKKNGLSRCSSASHLPGVGAISTPIPSFNHRKTLR